MKKTLLSSVVLGVISFNAQAANIKIIKQSENDPFDKPIIIAEGYDPLNQNGLTEHLANYASTINSITASGRDVVLVDFDDGGASVQTNADELKTVITAVNGLKVGNHPNAVIGVSMGGLISRMALKQMENANQDHQTSLYISYDSPHRGANIPKEVYSNIEQYYSYFNLFGSKPLESVAPDLINVRKAFRSSAAKQMLIWGANALSFYKELESLGYPNDLTRVAVTNGSNLGSTYGHNSNFNTLDYKVELLQLKTYRHGITYKNLAKTVCKFPCDKLKNTYYDNAPGSFLIQDGESVARTYYDGILSADSGSRFDVDIYSFIDTHSSFVPTLSALDIRNFDITTPVTSALWQRHSPFDKVYFSAYGNNLRHDSINTSAIFSALAQYHNNFNSIPNRTHKKVPLADVNDLSIEWISGGNNILTWKPVPGATHYQIFSEESFSANYQAPIKTVTPINNSVDVITNIIVGKTKKVAVRACNDEVCSYGADITAKFHNSNFHAF